MLCCLNNKKPLIKSEEVLFPLTFVLIALVNKIRIIQGEIKFFFFREKENSNSSLAFKG